MTSAPWCGVPGVSSGYSLDSVHPTCPNAALGSPSVLLGVTLLTGGQPQRGGQSRQRNACLAGFNGGRVHPILIEGSAGVALTLHSIATGTTGGWQTCLLLD